MRVLFIVVQLVFPDDTPGFPHAQKRARREQFNVLTPRQVFAAKPGVFMGKLPPPDHRVAQAARVQRICMEQMAGI